MASSLRFITSNPVTEGLKEGEQRRSEDLRQENEAARIDEAKRHSTEEQGTDAAIRSALRPTPTITPTPAAPPQQGLDPTAMASAASEGRPMPPAPVPAPTAGPAPMPGQPVAAPQASPTDHVAAALSRVPGGGRMALTLTQNSERRRDQQEQNVLHYLSNPQTADIGMQMAQRIGMNIPPQLASNTNFWQASAIAKQLYEGDIAAAQKFTSAFVQSQQPDINAKVNDAVAAAGAPVRKKHYAVAQGDNGLVFYDVENPTNQVAGPTKTTGQYITDDKGGVQFIQSGQTVSRPITTPDGQPLRGQKFGEHGGNKSVYSQKYEGWLAAHPGDMQGALDFANNRKAVSPMDMQKVASQVASREAHESMTPLGPDWLRSRTLELMQEWQKPGGGPTPPAAPAPTAHQPPAGPASPAAPAQPSVPQTYSDGQTQGTFTGQFQGSSPIYQTQDGRRFVVE